MIRKSNNTPTFVVIGASCFLAGLFTGALAMVFAKAGSSPTAASIVPAFIPLPMAKNPYPGSTLAPVPNDIKPEDAAVIRNFLKRESDSGKWEEVEWNRVAPPKGDAMRFFGLGISGADYGINLAYRSQNRLGSSSLSNIHCIFYANSGITIFGGPLTLGDFRTVTRSGKQELFDPLSQLGNDADRAFEMLEATINEREAKRFQQPRP